MVFSQTEQERLKVSIEQERLKVSIDLSKN